jgi:hypothetical protein
MTCRGDVPKSSHRSIDRFVTVHSSGVSHWRHAVNRISAIVCFGVPESQVDMLIKATVAFRSILHSITLDGQPNSGRGPCLFSCR